MIDWVREDLEAWGVFMKGGAVRLGFPNSSIEYRMSQFGPDSLIKDCKKRVAADPYVPDTVARAERVLLAMGSYNRKLLVVAFTVMVSREKQSKIFSKTVGYPVSRRVFMRDMDNAQSWYSGYIEAESKFVSKINVDTCAQKSV